MVKSERVGLDARYITLGFEDLACLRIHREIHLQSLRPNVQHRFPTSKTHPQLWSGLHREGPRHFREVLAQGLPSYRLPQISQHP